MKATPKKVEQTRYGTAESRWAGVGPYYAMFPTDFAVTAVKEFTKTGEYVLDPFAGRATSLFAAAATSRVGIGIEINPVGWVYGKAKLQAARREEVEDRLRQLGRAAANYRAAANQLPEFFHRGYCREVREFLLAARHLLDWRRNKTDWTTMALLLVDLHGKREAALSNQMRQTKSMSPPYAVAWWKDQNLMPPERDPVKWMLKKVAWRYAKGCPDASGGRVYLGDCRTIMKSWSRQEKSKASLLLTSPPYYGVTNYFYDQWLRLWLLGGPEKPQSTGHEAKSKFAHKEGYVAMLRAVFTATAPLLKRTAIINVRTDARQFTRQATLEALELAFPRKKIRRQTLSRPNNSQTTLFDPDFDVTGEVDFVMW